MKKISIQGFAIVVLFLSTWLLLKQVDWVGLFKIEKTADKTEEKFSEYFLETFKKSETENYNPYVTSSIDSLVSKICKKNGIDRSTIKVHVFNKDEVNAFALPDGHLVIYSGLILEADNQDELAGVICHELAHIQLNHVMKKLVKEVGLSVLISIATGNGGAEKMEEIARLLSSTAFDRNFEKEADIKAVEYLINAKMNPDSFANFLFKLSDDKNDTDKYFSWISTHPDSKERAEYVIEYSKNKKKETEIVLSSHTWNKLKEQFKEL